jgi:hypothetical protein
MGNAQVHRKRKVPKVAARAAAQRLCELSAISWTADRMMNGFPQRVPRVSWAKPCCP